MKVSAEDFDTFYLARAPGLIRTLYLRTGDMAQAQDCAQEAFIRAWKRWHRLGADDPSAWVLTVAWRLAVSDWRRHAARRSPNPGEVALQDPAERLDAVMDLRQAVSALPTHQQTAIVLHYFEDLPIAQIAHMSGRPEGTVKSDLSRGRTELRRALEAMPSGIGRKGKDDD